MGCDEVLCIIIEPVSSLLPSTSRADILSRAAHRKIAYMCWRDVEYLTNKTSG